MVWTKGLGSPPLGGPLLLSSRRIESSNDMGKRFDALRVALALPKRTNWKAAYSTVDAANRTQLELINLLRKQKQEQVVRADIAEQTVTRLVATANSLSKRTSLIEKAIEAEGQSRSDAEKMREPFNFKQGDATSPHSYETGHEGNPWKCKVCGNGTRDLRHRDLPAKPTPTKERLPNRLEASVDIGSETYQTPSERSTDGYYVSGRSLNYSASNPNRRRAFVHVFTCDNIRSRRDDSTVVVQGDPDYRRTKKTIGGWLWGPDMKAVRSIAKAHRKYTKLCDCITSERDFADNSNGQIGSLITTESES